MHHPPPPDSRGILPPLLACLPVAFASPRPPPALLPLLAPVLRQRLSYLTSTGTQRSDGWLPLLCWDGERGARLPEVVERMELEPHPVSGELELDDVRPAKYRRLDEETLHARLEVEQFEILPIYVWCDEDEHGATGPGWKLAEMRALDDIDDGLDWHDSITEANDAIPARRASLVVPGANETVNGAGKASTAGSDDDAYWAAYDRSQGQTPAPKPEPEQQQRPQRTAYNRQRSQSELDYFARYGSENAAPAQQQAPTSILRTHGRQRSRTEFDYFARYGNEVQPALDQEDPDEKAELERNNITTTNRDSVLQPDLPRAESRPSGASLYPADSSVNRPSNSSENSLQPFPSYNNDIPAPRAISPGSRSSQGSGIERLEQRARAISEAQSQASDVAQTAIKQHISTDIKSLFRLARNTGIEKRDFERIVKRELDCLSMLEQDDCD